MRFTAPHFNLPFKGALILLLTTFLVACQSSPPSQHSSPGLRAEGNHSGKSRETVMLRTARGPGAAKAEEVHTLWGRIRQGFMLEPGSIDNPRIDQQRLSFLSQPRYFELTGVRAERYLHYVVEQLDARGMPLELALLPFVESGYNPMAYSRSHAAGIWQFIPSTGEYFSLRQDWWYDGRRDITASTQAALDYLTRLNVMFDGDWLLAVAAYNCGEGCVGRAMQRNQQLGLPTDYWNLQLPQETMNYVPKLLALSQIIDSPSLHGTVLPDLANTPYFAEVTIEQQIDLSKAAELANMDTDDFIQLNPAFNQRVTAPQGAYQLLVPVDRAEQFSDALARLPASERVGFQQYQVRSGDTLSQIASRHQVSVDAIREVNQLSGNLINVGQTLMLPRLGSAPMVAAAAPRSAPSASPTGSSYRVQAGDNLSSIARQHNLSIAALKQHNNLNTSALQIGQTLRIPGSSAVASTSAPAQTRSITYTVKPGDSLYSIARQFNIAIDRIREQNRLGQHLRAGQQLTLLLP